MRPASGWNCRTTKRNGRWQRAGSARAGVRRDPHREFEGLLVVEPRIDLRAIGTREIAFDQAARSADAFRDVLARQFEVDAAEAGAAFFFQAEGGIRRDRW